MSESGYVYGRGGSSSGGMRGQRWTNWRNVTGANGESRGQVRYNGRRVEYSTAGSQGASYGNLMRTATARSTANNVTRRVNNRINRR